jgi:hypothetical protein
MSDSDAAFKGNDRDEDQNFQKILCDNNAVLEPVILNNHHTLGIIDVLAKNLKSVLSKEFLENKARNGLIFCRKSLNNTTTHRTHHL